MLTLKKNKQWKFQVFRCVLTLHIFTVTISCNDDLEKENEWKRFPLWSVKNDMTLFTKVQVSGLLCQIHYSYYDTQARVEECFIKEGIVFWSSSSSRLLSRKVQKQAKIADPCRVRVWKDYLWSQCGRKLLLRVFLAFLKSDAHTSLWHPEK